MVMMFVRNKATLGSTIAAQACFINGFKKDSCERIDDGLVESVPSHLLSFFRTAASTQVGESFQLSRQGAALYRPVGSRLLNLKMSATSGGFGNTLLGAIFDKAFATSHFRFAHLSTRSPVCQGVVATRFCKQLGADNLESLSDMVQL